MIGRALDGIRRSPLIQLVAVGTIALSLVLVGVVALAALNVRRLASLWGGDVQMTVYLEEGAARERQQQIAQALAKLPGVDDVRQVSSHEAYERLRRSLGGRSDLLDGVEESFLPASLEVTLKPGVVDVIRAHPAFERLRKAAGVEEVELHGDWAARLQRVQSLLTDVGLAVGFLVLCACLYVVGATIRLGVFARRDEIAIMQLVGATHRFVKGPFLVEGALQGTIGAASAVALLYALYALAQPRVEAALGGLLSAAPITFFRPLEIGIAVAAGTLLGLVGSSVALGRYVRAA
jgi:cell division transport system permease protein